MAPLCNIKLRTGFDYMLNQSAERYADLNFIVPTIKRLFKSFKDVIGPPRICQGHKMECVYYMMHLIAKIDKHIFITYPNLKNAIILQANIILTQLDNDTIYPELHAITRNALNEALTHLTSF